MTDIKKIEFSRKDVLSVLIKALVQEKLYGDSFLYTVASADEISRINQTGTYFDDKEREPLGTPNPTILVWKKSAFEEIAPREYQFINPSKT